MLADRKRRTFLGRRNLSGLGASSLPLTATLLLYLLASNSKRGVLASNPRMNASSTPTPSPPLRRSKPQGFVSSYRSS
jgi:hypothetical protein